MAQTSLTTAAPFAPMASPGDESSRSKSNPLSDIARRPNPDRFLPLFLAGGAFFFLSVVTTRRSLHRRAVASYPSFYHPSNRPPVNPVNGAAEAAQALGIATMNVVSGAMMVTGGVLWGMRIQGMDDMRTRMRRAMGVGESGDADQELEEWVAGVLSRKEEREGKGGGEEGKRKDGR
ncbi:MAG: hypothetical protein M1833_003165 [Piccolia ochrophora]|nr:MAG: hypothetical protein M1833_003165 [Piccolia ochrophora]